MTLWELSNKKNIKDQVLLAVFNEKRQFFRFMFAVLKKLNYPLWDDSLFRGLSVYRGDRTKKEKEFLS